MSVGRFWQIFHSDFISHSKMFFMAYTLCLSLEHNLTYMTQQFFLPCVVIYQCIWPKNTKYTKSDLKESFSSLVESKNMLYNLYWSLGMSQTHVGDVPNTYKCQVEINSSYVHIFLPKMLVKYIGVFVLK